MNASSHLLAFRVLLIGVSVIVVIIGGWNGPRPTIVAVILAVALAVGVATGLVLRKSVPLETRLELIRALNPRLARRFLRRGDDA
jgi:hypothetical protein